jgi:predicted small lipoprotein YifL
MPDRKLRRATFAAITIAAMAALAGCGSSGGNPGTTPDTYTVAVMASNGTTTQPATFTVTVQ